LHRNRLRPWRTNRERLCAKAGLKVLVLERNQQFGGAAVTYRHHGLTIEASLHELDGFDEYPKMPLLQALGLSTISNSSMSATFMRCGDFSGANLFVLHHGFDAALEAAVRRFPEHEAGLEEHFQRL
jgi:all-trans-retinol 13,14-reductase